MAVLWRVRNKCIAKPILPLLTAISFDFKYIGKFFKTFHFFVVALAIVFLTSYSHADDLKSSIKNSPDSEELTEAAKNAGPDGYEINYAYTFFLYDACGYVDLGGKIRGLIIDKLDQCGFNENAKMIFYQAALDNAQGFAGMLMTHIKSPTPDTSKYLTRYCDAYKDSSIQNKLEELKNKIDSYNHHKLTLDEIGPMIVPNCKQGASFAPGAASTNTNASKDNK